MLQRRRLPGVVEAEHEDAALPLEELCKKSIPPQTKLLKRNNRAFQIKSWNVGCEKRKSTLDKCKTACNNGCCGTTCASNSCSGGGCCTASKNICKEACNFMFDPQTYNVINVYNNITQIINKTKWINTIDKNLKQDKNLAFALLFSKKIPNSRVLIEAKNKLISLEGCNQ